MKLKNDLAVILGGYGGNSKSTLFVNLTTFEMSPGPKMKSERYAFACTTFNSQAHEKRPVIIVVGSETGTGDSAAILDYTKENSKWDERKSITLSIWVTHLLGYPGFFLSPRLTNLTQGNPLNFSSSKETH